MRVNYHRLHFGMLACVFALIAITLYMAFAFPHSLVHFKQADTTQLKAVLMVGRHGEVSPPREAYFEALGEEPPEEWYALGGEGQLTSMGKERLYLLGKFLRLQYYERLLAGGNPRRVQVRSADSDRCLESAQALLAGLLPPASGASAASKARQWLWSANGDADPLVQLWQPKAVHSASERDDDLLSSQTKCLQVDSLRARWKNSSRYGQLLNEFRHDLQVLRQNTGLAFEDDLEVASDLEEQLRARASFAPFAGSSAASGKLGPMPSWYTSTLAARLAHMADVTAGARFAQASAQRLWAGRLLDTLVTNVFGRIRSDLSSGVSLLNDDEDNPEGAGGGGGGGGTPSIPGVSLELNDTTMTSAQRRLTGDQLTAGTKLLPPEEQAKLRLAHQREPLMFLYLTDKHHLTALMSSLGVYASQPLYGAALLLELHYDPVNQVHFLRLFALNSLSHNVLPEPVRVQPVACLDSVECSPQQFERNLRHLALDKQAWQQACLVGGVQEQPVRPAATTETPRPRPPTPDSHFVSSTEIGPSLEFVGPTERSDASTSGPPVVSPQPWPSPLPEASTTMLPDADSQRATTQPADNLEKLDESLIVGPANTRPISGGQTASEAARGNTTEDPAAVATTIFSSITEIKATTTTTTTSAPETTTSQGSVDAPASTNSNEPTTTQMFGDHHAEERTVRPAAAAAATTTTTSESADATPAETIAQMTPTTTTTTASATTTLGKDFASGAATQALSVN